MQIFKKRDEQPQKGFPEGLNSVGIPFEKARKAQNINGFKYIFIFTLKSLSLRLVLLRKESIQ